MQSSQILLGLFSHRCHRLRSIEQANVAILGITRSQLYLPMEASHASRYIRDSHERNTLSPYSSPATILARRLTFSWEKLESVQE